jgi:hypothetical protein
MADRLVSVDSETLRFPDAVSEQIGVDAEDRSTPLGGAVDRVARRAPFEPAGLSDATQAQLSATFATVLVYSGGAYPSRPAGAASVTYIGPVQPTGWLANDFWTDNS